MSTTFYEHLRRTKQLTIEEQGGRLMSVTTQQRGNTDKMSNNCIYRFIDRTESTLIVECAICDDTVELVIPVEKRKCERLSKDIAIAIAMNDPLPIPLYWTVAVAYDMPGHTSKDAATELALFLREEAFGDVEYEIVNDDGTLYKIKGRELRDPDAIEFRHLHSV